MNTVKLLVNACNDARPQNTSLLLHWEVFMYAFYCCRKSIGIRCLRNHITSFYFPHYENSYNLNCKLCSLARMTLFTIQTWIKITGVSYYITYLNKGMFIHEALGESVNMALCYEGRFCQVLKPGPRAVLGTVVFTVVDCKVRDAGRGAQDCKVIRWQDLPIHNHCLTEDWEVQFDYYAKLSEFAIHILLFKWHFSNTNETYSVTNIWFHLCINKKIK